MKILTFTTLYPSSARPNHGIFVENRLRKLNDKPSIDIRVIAPVPYFPLHSASFGTYAAYANTPKAEMRGGLAITHPRFPLIPKVGMTLAPLFLYLATRSKVQALLDSGFKIDLIDAHYFYPDGVAAALLAKHFNLPFSITARGTDLNLIPQYYGPRKQILWAAERADGLITVCQALKDSLVELGVSDERVTVLRNGVDLDVFKPGDRDAIRTEMNLSGQVVLSVGHLVERKGHHLAIEALRDLPDSTLLIVGEGHERKKLQSLVATHGLGSRVRFLGSVPHEDLHRIYSAADVLVLASSREGWPNVLLEAMACGTPVVATKVWGSGEVVQTHAAGLLAENRTARDISQALKTLLTHLPSRDETRRYAEQFSWDATTQGQLELFNSILSRASR